MLWSDPPSFAYKTHTALTSLKTSGTTSGQKLYPGCSLRTVLWFWVSIADVAHLTTVLIICACSFRFDNRCFFVVQMLFTADGRMDSPGFCAQYCTYTVMENDTKEIVSVVNVDKRETNRTSVIMEKEGFIRSFESLCQEVKLAEVCTDAHTQISALFSKSISMTWIKWLLFSFEWCWYNW